MCQSQCKTYVYKPYVQRIKYLARLPDYTKLDELALIGTHSSLSYSAAEIEFQTQDLNLAQQLKYGIRVLDIGVHPQINLFKICSNNAEYKIRFDQVLFEIDEFLDDNPSEFIIILIRQVYPPAFDVSKSNCDIISFYADFIIGGRRIVTKWRLEDTIGQYRGKILLAGFDGSFRGCTFDIRNNCKIQNDYNTITKNNIYNTDDKWMVIIPMINHSHSNSYRCYINDISFYNGINSRRVIAKDGGYYCNNVCASPLNHLMATYFYKTYNVLSIVLADFVTQELIDKINNQNFFNQSWRH
ncbi:1-phosphatidylinositol phosphodiesterase-like [Microplitis demolitor]|uniref:1-phosphatidylinositol phosphodiesterase-like n=1 Tax=Microplitis demolitor TaxID=69319 RepID=UPI0004CCD990|nr:1-phosphatidylinositol phosphodiesterase-like [Microplitis demolitor]